MDRKRDKDLIYQLSVTFQNYIHFLLLTFEEVTTLFHEFGHALHGILANTNYSGLSGTNVFWDFVELPSQIMENWCYEKEALELLPNTIKRMK